MYLVVRLLLSNSGVVVAAVAYVNRDKSEWQRDMRKISVIAIGQVALGVVASIMVGRWPVRTLIERKPRQPHGANCPVDE